MAGARLKIPALCLCPSGDGGRVNAEQFAHRTKGGFMTYPRIVSRDEWLVARQKLLIKEKEATRARDRLNAERRRLPMVKIDKAYRFEGPNGPVSLADLFDGHRQLIVYHFMFDPSWDE